MSKIIDVLNIKTGYSEVVRLKEEFNNKESNLSRMSNYRPIKAHRIAFNELAKSPFTPDSKRCYILSGSYGTGKSHLCLMLANYFNQPSTNEKMNDFFEQYKASEKEDKVDDLKAEQLKNRRVEGKFLVAICDYDLNDSFETVVLRAVRDALNREGISENEINSIYFEAVKKINSWKNSKNDYFQTEFKKKLEDSYPEWTIGRLKDSLNNYDKDALNIFKEIHKKITTANFTYDADNLNEILDGLINSEVIKDNFNGMVILFDEFDYQLENKRISLNSFQKFGEKCEESFKTNFPLLFVATTHRSFTSYTDYYNQADFKTVSDRVDEIAMETNGIEDIIAAIVNPQKDSELWKQKINPHKQVFTELANKCGDLKIFDWLSRPKLRNNIVTNIYPMHPLATYCLMQLSLDLGSNNRSVFKFFASKKEIEESYYDFANKNDILDAEGKLNLYSVDRLFGYFSNEISSNNDELYNTVREKIRDYESSVREFNKFIKNSDELPLKKDFYKRILKTMLINRLSGIINDVSNLEFGLNIMNKKDKVELERALKTLQQNRIIFEDVDKEIFEFKRSDSLDVSQKIRDIKYKDESKPKNVFEEINNMISNLSNSSTKKLLRNNKFIEAKRYNSDFLEDKRFRIKFITLKEFEEDNLFDKLISEVEDKLLDVDGYEGIYLIVTCETEDEINVAKKIAHKNNYDRILVSIPKNETPIFNRVHTIKAINQIERDGLSTQDIMLINEKLGEQDKKLGEALSKYLNKNNMNSFTVKGKISTNVNENKEPIDKLMESIYGDKRNLIQHKDLNCKHKFSKSRATALKEAVNDLLNFSKDIKFNTQSSADSGDIRYLRKVFHDKKIIEKIDNNNNRIFCKINRNMSNYGSLPALKDMINEIKNAENELNLINFVNNYVKDYGQGYKAIILFLAFVLRYFKDSLMVIPEIDEAGNLRIKDFQTLYELVYEKKKKNAVLQYRELHEPDKKMLTKLSNLFSKEHESTNNIEYIYDRMVEWYNDLPNICKAEDIYDDKRVRFVRAFSEINNINPRKFLLDEIKKIYSIDSDDWLDDEMIEELVSKIKRDKSKIENGFDYVRGKIVEGLKEIFSSEAINEDKLIEEIKKWNEGLKEKDVDLEVEFENNHTGILLKYIKRDIKFNKMFLEGIATETVGSVENWSKDRTEEYLNIIDTAKREIENFSKVDIPNYNFEGKNKKELNDVVYYNDIIQINIEAKKSHSFIYLTSNGDDPRKDNVQKLQNDKLIEFKTSDNKKIKFCAKNKEGKFSKVITFDLKNKDKKYISTVTKKNNYVKQKLKYDNTDQFQEDIDEYEITAYLPNDESSFKIFLKDIIRNSKEKYSISDDEIKDIFKEIIDEM